MTITIRLAVRDWDYFTSLALGDIKPRGFTLAIDRVGTLPDDLAHSPHSAAMEIPKKTPLVQARNVHKYFGDNHVLRGIELDVKSGETVVILRPSCSGKSTFLRCINHLEEMD